MHHILMYETKCSKLYHAKSHTCIPSSVANGYHDHLNTDVRNVVYLQQWITITLYSYICRVCMKPCKDKRAWENHEGDAHGNRMLCGRCRFSCPERRPGKMLAHLRKRHHVETGPLPNKRR